MAFIVVQHLAAAHTSLLAEILGRATKMSVCEVQDEPCVAANHVYVIPPGRTMTIKGGVLSLLPRDARQHHPIDLFFTSLAEDQGHRAIGVVLSGTATDGTAGLASIKTAGGITFAQDDSAQYEGMPRNAIDAGVVDLVLPPARIAQEIVLLKEHPYVADESRIDPRDDVDPVLAVLRKQVGVDFSQYKSNTLHRRIRRRMALHKLGGLDDYAVYLRGNAVEVEALYQDILISVTSFFRNPEAFEALRTRVFPKLLKDRARGDPLRIWVLGCSTGEEPYSLAIALCEFASELHSNVPIVIYATDLNNVAIEKARAGFYPKSIAEHVSPERLRRFFIEAHGGYCITKSIRDLCVFARHNALSDPPFSRMDLISCRNVMIYFEAALQRRLMPVLHYALKPSGFLILGPSETTGAGRELFDAEDMRNKIFTKRIAALPASQGLPLASHIAPLKENIGSRWIAAHLETPRVMQREVVTDIQRDADRVLLARYVPAGVLVNADCEVLQFRGDTGLYLTPAPGKASLNVLKMAREGLLVSLRALLQRARKDNKVAREQSVRVRTNGGYSEVTVSVIPVGNSKSRERCYWVLFEPTPQPAAKKAVPSAKTPRARVMQDKLLDEKSQIAARLTQELAATREYLQSVIEQQEAANEELQSANEEVQSANEELQSINEELETSKEEIQSSNEELMTVNEELQNRNEELNRANNDFNNLFASVQMAIVMVWPDLRIRRFTPMAEKLFNLIPTDVGRPVGDIKLNLDVPNLLQLLAEAIDSVATREIDVRDHQGRWYLLRIRPYRTLENKIDGAVILLVDIDILKQSQETLARKVSELDIADRQKNEFLAMLAHELRNPLVPVRNAVQILRKPNANEGMMERARDLIGRQVDILARLIDDLLDGARINRGQVQLRMETLELQAVVRRALETISPIMEQRHHRFSFSASPVAIAVEGDPVRLEQVFANLIGNAAKYTPDGGHISVVIEQTDSDAVIKIRDNGVGITAEMLGRVFELFVQADQSLARTSGGLGIGLSIVRSLVELHGGSVDASSDGLGKGSEFTVRLPLSNQEIKAPEEGKVSRKKAIRGSVAQGNGISRVLIVDDNADIAESTSTLLSLSGYEVQTASSGEQALEVAASFHPNAVLLDIGMPGLDGYQVCRKLRRQRGLERVKLIAVTGYGASQDRERAENAGFDYYLLKPFDSNALVELLKEAAF
jgi:two-component system CheB/CheR fusion protein